MPDAIPLVQPNPKPFDGASQHISKSSKNGDRFALIHDQLELAAIGLESEFSVFLDGEPAKPESIFHDPRDFIRAPLVHRIGKSYHLPTGGAIYFDTGVIEIATPVIEIERGCAARAGRSLWEGILFMREELDVWQKKAHREIRLQGFSTHYNISFDVPAHEQHASRTVKKLALLLTYILPVPVMLLAANKLSTGIGVRPRGNRIEITADFTPDAALMIAAASLITGIVRSVMQWPSYELDMLEKEGLPYLDRFRPQKHTSRKGWLARFDSYHRNPFEESVNDQLWVLRGEPGLRSLRELAQWTFRKFYFSIARVSDPFTFRLIRSVISGRTTSLLELPTRPEAYDHVGKLCTWNNLFPQAVLNRSRYEQVLINAIEGHVLRLRDDELVPKGMRGWSKVIFQSKRTSKPIVLSIDYLVKHLRNWNGLT